MADPTASNPTPADPSAQDAAPDAVPPPPPPPPGATAGTPVATAAGATNADVQGVLDEAASAVRDLQSEVDAAGGSGRTMGEAPPTPADARAEAFDLPAFSAASSAEKPQGIDLLADVQLNVKIELGRTKMLVEDVLKLGEGVVVELDKLAGDPVDVYANGRHIARGEVLVLNDAFCVRIHEVLDSAAELKRGRQRAG